MMTDQDLQRMLSIVCELVNISENQPVFPGEALSHGTANRCVHAGMAERNKDGDFVLTTDGENVVAVLKAATVLRQNNEGQP